MNPYEPPKSRPKYKPPVFDWLGIGIAFSVISIIIFGYLIFVGTIVEWFR
jgi:hypothetical protein